MNFHLSANFLTGDNSGAAKHWLELNAIVRPCSALLFAYLSFISAVIIGVLTVSITSLGFGFLAVLTGSVVVLDGAGGVVLGFAAVEGVLTIVLSDDWPLGSGAQAVILIAAITPDAKFALKLIDASLSGKLCFMKQKRHLSEIVWY
ncbi:hypothetical protein [Azospirillum himalayense]|uniref:hypothetical protein n=1 Tax=Azospirillum himalayense TaxID=654847 RepID=UPI0036729778